MNRCIKEEYTQKQKIKHRVIVQSLLYLNKQREQMYNCLWLTAKLVSFPEINLPQCSCNNLVCLAEKILQELHLQ
jgi:hypothetical protein